MTMINVQTRGNTSNITIDSEGVVTVLDLKKRINKDPTAVLLTFKGKILTDSTPIESLGSDVVFVMERDIEFTEMEQEQLRVRVGDKVVTVSPSQVFFKNNKPFLVTARRQKIKVKDITEILRNTVTPIHIMQCLFVLFLVATRNYPIMAIVAMINFLKLVSLFILRVKLWVLLRGRIYCAVFMFFASLLAIDHEKFYATERVI